MTNDTPNATSTATVENAVPSLDSIASKMAAMRESTLRNQIRATEQTETGETESPVAPEEPEITSADADVIDYAAEDFAPESDQAEQPAEPEETVSEDTTEATTQSEELIDFIEFAETNPQAKFKFMRNGKEMVIDAKRAAAILGQGGAIHEEARQLKIEKSEFDEYVRDTRARQEGLTLAMEFTIEPQLHRAYDEIVKTQGYQATFQQQLAQTQDPAQQARIYASMDQNERYIQQQTQLIGQIRPVVDQYRQARTQQVTEVLTNNRRRFTDKELKNEFVYNELREKIAKSWSAAGEEVVPGVKNIDLISSDEFLLSLVRDGLKYRDRPATTKQAGSSLATLTRKSAAAGGSNRSSEESITKLREQAQGGDKKAADNLLVAQLSKLRAARTGR
jgi:hypothetical protein